MYKCTGSAPFARRLTDGSGNLLMKAVCVRADPDYRDSSVTTGSIRCLPRRTEQLVAWWARGDAPVGCLHRRCFAFRLAR